MYMDVGRYHTEPMKASIEMSDRTNRIDVEATANDMAAFLRCRYRIIGRRESVLVRVTHGKTWAWMKVCTPGGNIDARSLDAVLVDMADRNDWYVADMYFVEANPYVL